MYQKRTFLNTIIFKIKIFILNLRQYFRPFIVFFFF